MKMCDGEIEWFYIQFKCLRGDGAQKISATKHTDGLTGCRTPSRGCSCMFPLWAADRSRKQPDRKSTGVFTAAAGSRVLRQSNLSCWKLKCDLTFNSNMNTFLSFFFSKGIQLLTIRTIEIVHQRWQTHWWRNVKDLTGSAGSETHRTEASTPRRPPITTVIQDFFGVFFERRPCRHLIDRPHYALRCSAVHWLASVSVSRWWSGRSPAGTLCYTIFDKWRPNVFWDLSLLRALMLKA